MLHVAWKVLKELGLCIFDVYAAKSNQTCPTMALFPLRGGQNQKYKHELLIFVTPKMS